MEKFEVRRTDAGWHCVLLGRNGEPVWTTEVYEDRADARKAIKFLLRTRVNGFTIVEVDQR